MFKKILIANRSEIAIRIVHAIAGLGLSSVAVFSLDDDLSLHTKKADEAYALPGRGVAAYLDQEALISIALQSGCNAIHPGYGFLSENAAFARRCEEEEIVFIGPTPETLDLFGNKSVARKHASDLGIPILAGTDYATSVKQARSFLKSLGPNGSIMLKAVAGGGGRGIRVVTSADRLEEAYEACCQEAVHAFGNGDIYVEQFMPRARHIEVQIIGDGTGEVAHLWERECSIQRRNQKLIEIAPALELNDGMREKLLDAAVILAKSVSYKNLGTFEFLVDVSPEAENRFAFIEANPRLQVEHTVTEEITGIDLVQLQIQLASGISLAELGHCQNSILAPRGIAMQVRINMETMNTAGDVKPSGGVLSAFDIPFGPGVRIDTCGYVGYRSNPAFDTLLAKVICYSSSTSFAAVSALSYRALCESRIAGFETNLKFLQELLVHPALGPEKIHTRFVDEYWDDLNADCADRHRQLYFEAPMGSAPVQIKAQTNRQHDSESQYTVRSAMQGTVVSLDAEPGDDVPVGRRILVLEAMKMQHSIAAETAGRLLRFDVAVGDTIFEGDSIYHLEPGETGEEQTSVIETIDPDHIRADLLALQARRSRIEDKARPEAVARRRKTNQRTARENISDVCDEGSFVENGGLTVAAQRSRRTFDELVQKTPADGIVTGIGTINASQFGKQNSSCAVLSYDYTVLAGTQGYKGHDKTDRMLSIAAKQHLPIVIFTEGGGGRPGDTDHLGVAGVDVLTFNLFAKLSGLVPLIGINSGRCFAGNAALLGCCDVIIATRNSTIGMGGPAMIEGGGLGVFSPEEVGPIDVQQANGVVDIVVEDEAEAVLTAKKYLSYFQGSIDEWDEPDQKQLRHVIPENRLEVYDIRRVIETIADVGSVLEIRSGFGIGMITALTRIEGRPVGIVANNPAHMAGAIDSDGADKAARFLQLCDGFDIPVLFLCDTPGIMVGPEAEKTAQVRHCSRLFVTGANITVPFFTIVLRKSYGLGAMAMAGGTFRAPLFSVAWPTGEFGPMGLDGAIKLGFRDELAAIEDPDLRKEKFDEMVAEAYKHGKALSTASFFEIDDVIDPAESRARLVASLRACLVAGPRTGKKRQNIDTW